MTLWCFPIVFLIIFKLPNDSDKICKLQSTSSLHPTLSLILGWFSVAMQLWFWPFPGLSLIFAHYHPLILVTKYFVLHYTACYLWFLSNGTISVKRNEIFKFFSFPQLKGLLLTCPGPTVELSGQSMQIVLFTTQFATSSIKNESHRGVLLLLSGHFYLAWPFCTLHGHSCLAWAFSPSCNHNYSGYTPHVPLHQA